jgi:protein phosphatase 2C family protein 2/3
MKSNASLLSNNEIKNIPNNNSKNKNKINMKNNNNSKKPVKNPSISQQKGGDINNNLNNKNININNIPNNNNRNNNLSLSKLSNLNYLNYPQVELSSNPFNKIKGYGANSYNGTVRDHNEDKLKIILEYKLDKIISDSNGVVINPNISYFAIYDGHAGNNCSNFLQENLHEYIFSSKYFPLYTMQAIKSAYLQAEKNFFSIATNIETGKILDVSGSCAVSALIMDEWCFVINLGDSRGLYSYDSGKKLYQITRDHKPNDIIEKERIEKAGGKVYKDDEVILQGEKIKIDEKNLPPGVVIPYRVIPGNLSVRKFYYNLLFIFLL